jgi:hypothetical protein
MMAAKYAIELSREREREQALQALVTRSRLARPRATVPESLGGETGGVEKLPRPRNLPDFRISARTKKPAI